MNGPEKCATCGVDILPTGGGGYTHVPDHGSPPACSDPNPLPPAERFEVISKERDPNYEWERVIDSDQGEYYRRGRCLHLGWTRQKPSPIWSCDTCGMTTDDPREVWSTM